jgi:hypothetical protein
LFRKVSGTWRGVMVDSMPRWIVPTDYEYMTKSGFDFGVKQIYISGRYRAGIPVR